MFCRSKNPAIWLIQKQKPPHRTKSGSLICYLPLMISLSLCKKSKISLASFDRCWWSKSTAIWLDKRHNWPHPTKSGSLWCYLSSMIISMQKSSRSVDSFQRYWRLKNPAIWLDKRHKWPHSQPKVVVSDATFPWWLSPCKKSKRSINSFQKYWWSNNPAIWLDERHIWSHSTNSSSLRGYFFWSPCKKSKRLIRSFQRHWKSKNTAIWLVESILGHNLRIRFSPNMQFLQNHKKHYYARFLV